jgi:Rab-GTPase-TBC domain
LVFYESKENLSKLWDILAVYAWIDKDVGYCQGGAHIKFVLEKKKWTTAYLSHRLPFYVGMSDLCSPMIILLEDEADAFWAFERLMRRLVLSPYILLCISFQK